MSNKRLSANGAAKPFMIKCADFSCKTFAAASASGWHHTSKPVYKIKMPLGRKE